MGEYSDIVRLAYRLAKIIMITEMASIKGTESSIQMLASWLAPEAIAIIPINFHNFFRHITSLLERGIYHENLPIYSQINCLLNRDLISRLTFGGYVLLQPELLDAHSSAMVIAAKEGPDGFYGAQVPLMQAI